MCLVLSVSSECCSGPSRWLPYAQLVRIPNVFTAVADIALAALVTGSLPGQFLPFVLLALASGCLYCAGEVEGNAFMIAALPLECAILNLYRSWLCYWTRELL